MIAFTALKIVRIAKYVYGGNNMELKDYTTEEIKAELKRRSIIEKEKREEERKTALRCRNCKHCIPHPNGFNFYYCSVRTWGKKIVRNYCTRPSNKACDKFERKEK